MGTRSSAGPYPVHEEALSHGVSALPAWDEQSPLSCSAVTVTHASPAGDTAAFSPPRGEGSHPLPDRAYSNSCSEQNCGRNTRVHAEVHVYTHVSVYTQREGEMCWEMPHLPMAQQGPMWQEGKSTLQAPLVTQDVWHCRRHFRDNDISYY